MRNKVDLGYQGAPYESYRRARNAIMEMLDSGNYDSEDISKYWRSEVAGFEYLFDASPLIVDRWREHCHHITGIRSYDYREHHSSNRIALRRKLQILHNMGGRDLFVPESPLLGGFGFEIEGDLVNIDTLKYYEALLAMKKGGLLKRLAGNGRKIVIEIGGGWGGFAYVIRKLFPNVIYIVVDLPHTLLFSSVYLMSLFPNYRHFFFGGDQQLSRNSFDTYDFGFVPNYGVSFLREIQPDLCVNMISFQEMTENQVRGYLDFCKGVHCPCIYSFNRKTSYYNEELDDLDSIISNYYNINEIFMMKHQYNEFPLPTTKGVQISKILRTVYHKMSPSSRSKAAQNYKHLVGTLKQE